MALPPLSQVILAQLAREVAMQIRDLPDTLAIFGLTPEQYEEVKALPFYSRTLELLQVEWNSAVRGPDRARLISAAFLEEALPVLGARMTDTGETLNAAVEAGKLLAKIAGLGEPKAAPTNNDKFVITINLGADQELKFEKDITPTPPRIEAGTTLLDATPIPDTASEGTDSLPIEVDANPERA